MYAYSPYRVCFCLFAFLAGGISLLLGQQEAGKKGGYLADFLPGQLISCLYQDSQGFLWAGSPSGLHRYDGSEFRTFSHRQGDSLSLSQGMVWAIFEDQAGFIWVGTARGLNRFDKRYESFERLGQQQGKFFDKKVSAIYEDRLGQFWIGTEAGLYTLNKKTFELSLYDAGQLGPSVAITGIMQDKAQGLWIGTEASGLFRLTAGGKALESFSQQNNMLESNAINHVLQTQKGELYVATDFGLAVFDKNLQSFRPAVMQGSQGDLLKRIEIEAMAEDSMGKLWMGTFENDLFCFDPAKQELRRISHFSASVTAAPNDLIYSLLVDRSGMLWIGTYLGGLHAYLSPQKKFELFQQAEGTTGEVYAVFEDQAKNSWLGTGNGLEVYDAEGKLRWQSEDEVAAIMQDRRGNIWLGTLGNGLKMCEKGSFWPPKEVDIALPPDDFSLLGGINALLEDQQERIWIATLEGIILTDLEGKLLARFGEDAEDSLRLDKEEVHCLFMDQKGSIWMGTDGGLRFFDKKISPLSIASEAGEVLDNSAVYAVEEDAKGNLWVATAEGLVQISSDKKAARLITTSDRDASSQLYGLLFDAQGDLWASNKKGLWRLKTGDIDEEVSLVTYLAQDGELPCDAFNFGAYHRTADDRLIFGCEEGAVVFRSEEVWQNVFAPPVVINSFQIGLEEVDFRDPESPLRQHISQTRKIVLPPGLYRITLGYTALNFIHPEANHFRYKMEKVDKEWIYDRGNQLAEYPLSSGNYVFHLQAANNDGVWNTEGTRLEIVIQRPFTQTIWFYLICLLLLAVSVVLFVRFRTRRLEQTQRKLEEKVALRTEEVNRKNVVLEKTLNELKEAQTQLVEQEKMASLGQLTAGVAHEINNPITFVSGNITPLKRDISEMMEILKGYEEEVESQGLSEKFERVAELKSRLDYEFLIQEIKQLLEGISEGAERTAEIVRGLRNFSRLDEDVLKLANVNQGIESTLLLLRSELKDRIEIVKDMPEMPDIHCYPGKLNGVYMNILTNAMQAIEGPGTIYITTRHLGKQVQISIRDTGKGMSEEVQKRIFEPFFTTKDVGFGTGLGLSITYGAIEQHKGKISVKSRLGEGTAFEILLPV